MSSDEYMSDSDPSSSSEEEEEEEMEIEQQRRRPSGPSPPRIEAKAARKVTVDDGSDSDESSQPVEEAPRPQRRVTRRSAAAAAAASAAGAATTTGKENGVRRGGGTAAAAETTGRNKKKENEKKSKSKSKSSRRVTRSTKNDSDSSDSDSDSDSDAESEGRGIRKRIRITKSDGSDGSDSDSSDDSDDDPFTFTRRKFHHRATEKEEKAPKKKRKKGKSATSPSDSSDSSDGDREDEEDRKFRRAMTKKRPLVDLNVSDDDDEDSDEDDMPPPRKVSPAYANPNEISLLDDSDDDDEESYCGDDPDVMMAGTALASATASASAAAAASKSGGAATSDALRKAREARERLVRAQRTRLDESSACAPDPTLYSSHNTSNRTLLGSAAHTRGIAVDVDDDDDAGEVMIERGNVRVVRLDSMPAMPSSSTASATAARSGEMIRLVLRTGGGGGGRSSAPKSTPFKVWTGEPMQRLLDDYRASGAVPATSAVEFHFDGEPMRMERTAESYDVEDGDLIDVIVKENALPPSRGRGTAAATAAGFTSVGPLTSSAASSGTPSSERIVLKTRIVEGGDRGGGTTRSWQIRRTDKLRKLVDAYRKERGYHLFPPGSVGIRRDGSDVDLDSTPLLQGMVDGQVLDLIANRKGGGGSRPVRAPTPPSKGSSAAGGGEVMLKLRINGDDKTTKEYFIGKNEPFQKLLDAFSQKQRRSKRSKASKQKVTLTLDGDSLSLTATCRQEDLEGGEIIDVIVK